MNRVRHEFTDNSQSLFGREPDLTYLFKRSEQPGVTAVVGRPQMGKTWLLTELARRLSQNALPAHLVGLNIPSLLGRPACRVGYFESTGEAADLLLRTLEDLYSRWLSDSSYWQQAQISFQQQKHDFVGRAGEAFATVIEKVAKGGGEPTAALGGIVKQAFEGLITANRDLNNPLGQLPRLQVAQGRELLELVAKVAKQPLVLIFDQWEKSPDLSTETNILDSFLRHLAEWPPCHIFLGTRPDAQALKTLNQFSTMFPGKAEIYELPVMHLEDAVSSSSLLKHIRERVPGSSVIAEKDLLQAISGYPGTISQWTSDYYATKLKSLEDFEQVARNAESNRFAELQDLLPSLPERSRLLSIRLSLLPQTGDPEHWGALKPVILEALSPKELDDLRRRKILESISPPSYGHAKRTEAALIWFQQNCYYEIREVCEDLIYQLGSHVRELSPQVLPYVSCLAELSELSKVFDLAMPSQSLCVSAQSLLGISLGASDVILMGAAAFRALPPHGSSALLAMGLYNTLIAAQQEQDLARRDALLQELRQLAADYPADAAVREWLAKCLYNTLNAAQQEQDLARRDALLQELRQLAADYRGDPAVREWLAKGLYNTLNAAQQEQHLARRDALLQELRQLAADYPDDLFLDEVTRLADAK